MVHVRTTGDWRLAPASDGQGAAAAPEDVVGVLSVEVDGVDLTAGRAEGAVLPALEGLLAAAARLLARGGRAAAPLADGRLLLVLQRAGERVELSLLEVGPPARLLVRGVAVDLEALAGATLDAAHAVGRELCRLPAGEAASRRLALAARAAERQPAPGPPGHREEARPEPAPWLLAARPRPGPHAHTSAGDAPLHLHVELADEATGLWLGPGEPADLAALLAPGRVTLAAGPTRLAVLEGLPFLTLRDLVDGLEEASRARRRGEPPGRLRLASGAPAREVALDLRHEAARAASAAGSTQALALASATVRAVEVLGHLAVRASPAHAANPALLELHAAALTAQAHLAAQAEGDAQLATAASRRASAPPRQRPLAHGELRRISLRTWHRAHVGAPVTPRLAAAGPVLLAFGRDAVVAHGGRRPWRAAGAHWAALAGGLVLVRREARLAALDPATGRERWSRALPGADPTGAAGRPGGPLLLCEPESLTALDPATGATRWRLDLPGSGGLALGRAGPLALVAGASGLVHGIAPDGGLAWRVRGPGPALAAPLACGRAVACLHAAGSGASLLFLDAASGARRGEVALDVRPSGAPLLVRGGLVVAGRSGGEAVLVRVDAARGRRWEVGLPLDGPPRPAAAGPLLVVGGDGGALLGLDPAGRVAWSLPAQGEGEGGAAPLLARGVVVASRGGVALLDAATGRPLGLAAGLSPAHLVAGPGLEVAALEVDGAVAWLGPGGHVSVLG
ncbi:MAG: PQQ-binding-like beta-propeller repeat protein [Anaeromyxobacter sp.]|nr:PQQ-binding-like beta-propeller repeat protein [Anaeromyxobacter sp.]MBL0277881.1 PQQ-binding-like beta-propeller repeat protein [Anaeromyxobacter sp.]